MSKAEEKKKKKRQHNRRIAWLLIPKCKGFRWIAGYLYIYIFCYGRLEKMIMVEMHGIDIK
jgi:hypothetical protein